MRASARVARGAVLSALLLAGPAARAAPIPPPPPITHPGSARASERVRALSDDARRAWSNDPRRAAALAAAALAAAEGAGDEPGRVDALRLLGRARYQLDEYAVALAHFKSSLSGAERLRDRERVADATNDLGTVHYVWGEYQEALDHYSRALALRKELGDPEKLASSYNNVGTINYALGADREALDYFTEALALYRASGAEGLAASTLNNVGLCQVRLARPAEAEASFRSALQTYERLGDRAGMALSLNHLGMAAESRAGYAPALDFYRRALRLRQELGDRLGVAIGLHNVGGMHARLGAYRRAVDEYLLPALAQAREIGVRETERDTLQLLSRTYEEMGDTGRALEYHRLYKQASDRLLDARVADRLASVRARFEIEKKDQEIELLREEQRRQRVVRNAILVGSVLLAGLAVLLFRSARLKDRANREMRRANDALRAAQAERERAARAELARVARVSLMGELATAFAHELKQPLTAIRSNAQAARRMLASGRGGGEGLVEVEETLADIADGAGRANEIMQRLRRLIRGGDVAREPVDVEELLREVRPFAEAAAQEHGARLDVRAAAGLPRIAGDRIQLQQVLLNLVQNAAEALAAAPRGERRIALQAEIGDAGGDPVRDGDGVPGGVRLLVRDNGPGVDDAALERLFEPFYTTKPDGLGMGLAICASIVDAHGGTLSAARNESGGLTLAVILPASPPGGGNAEPAALSASRTKVP